MVLNHYSTERPTKKTRTCDSTIEQKSCTIKPQGVWWGCADGHIEEMCMISFHLLWAGTSNDSAPTGRIKSSIQIIFTGCYAIDISGTGCKCLEIILFISIVLCFESRELVGPIPGPRLTWRRIQERARGSRRTPQSKRWANKVWKYPKYPKIHPNLKNGRKCS